jgi:hypothetical protein
MLGECLADSPASRRYRGVGLELRFIAACQMIGLGRKRLRHKELRSTNV